jgi:hypothetical protein
MTAHDPMQTVYDALEARGCRPRGPAYKHTAHCPAHEDRSPSLSVCEGADGRALIHCHAYCEPDDVVRALGLQWPDLFPDGHRHAGPRRAKPQPVGDEHPVEAVLAALGVTGIGWHRTIDQRMFVADRCPGCDERRPGALWIFDAAGRALLTCWNGCTFETILATLEHELTTPERVAT